MSQDEVDELVGIVKEIRDALLGTFEKKGLISRVRYLERIASVQGWALGVTVTAIIGGVVKSIIG